MNHSRYWMFSRNTRNMYFLFRVCKYWSVAQPQHNWVKCEGMFTLRYCYEHRRAHLRLAGGDGIRTIWSRFVCHDPESTGTELNARTLSEPLSHWITNVLLCGGQKASAKMLGVQSVAEPFVYRSPQQPLGVGQEALVGASRRPAVRRQPRAHPPRRHGPAAVNLWIAGCWHRKWESSIVVI